MTTKAKQKRLSASGRLLSPDDVRICALAVRQTVAAYQRHVGGGSDGAREALTLTGKKHQPVYSLRTLNTKLKKENLARSNARLLRVLRSSGFFRIVGTTGNQHAKLLEARFLRHSPQKAYSMVINTPRSDPDARWPQSQRYPQVADATAEARTLISLAAPEDQPPPPQDSRKRKRVSEQVETPREVGTQQQREQKMQKRVKGKKRKVQHQGVHDRGLSEPSAALLEHRLELGSTQALQEAPRAGAVLPAVARDRLHDSQRTAPSPWAQAGPYLGRLQDHGAGQRQVAFRAAGLPYLSAQQQLQQQHQQLHQQQLQQQHQQLHQQLHQLLLQRQRQAAAAALLERVSALPALQLDIGPDMWGRCSGVEGEGEGEGERAGECGVAGGEGQRISARRRWHGAAGGQGRGQGQGPAASGPPAGGAADPDLQDFVCLLPKG